MEFQCLRQPPFKPIVIAESCKKGGVVEGDGADTSLFGEVVRQVSRNGRAGAIAGEDQFATAVAHIMGDAAELLDAHDRIRGFDQFTVRE